MSIEINRTITSDKGLFQIVLIGEYVVSAKKMSKACSKEVARACNIDLDKTPFKIDIISENIFIYLSSEIGQTEKSLLVIINKSFFYRGYQARIDIASKLVCPSYIEGDLIIKDFPQLQKATLFGKGFTPLFDLVTFEGAFCGCIGAFCG